MTKLTHLLIVLTCVVGLAACNKDEDTKDSRVDENGLTPEINAFVTVEVLEAMRKLNMPIYGGETPPDITGQFLAAPFALKASSVPSDSPGDSQNDFLLTLSDQRNEDLTIRLKTEQTVATSQGLGAFVVGKDNQFSVFAEVEYYISSYDETATFLQVISGTMTPEGVRDMQVASFILRNPPTNVGPWIPDNTGRIAYDTDGFSERK